MLKKRSNVLIFAAAVIVIAQLIQADGVANPIVDPCKSTATSAAGVIVACPRGDGKTLGAAGLTISVTIRDGTNAPIAGMPRTDIWLVGCNFLLVLCGGSSGINATAATNPLGQTTIAGAIPAGGCETGVRVVCQGVVIGGSACPACLAIAVRSPDLVGPAGGPPDFTVNNLDLAKFAADYRSPPKAYKPCIDYAAPFGTVDLKDFAVFGGHFGHVC